MSVYLSLIIFKMDILVSQVREVREIVLFKVSSMYLNNELKCLIHLWTFPISESGKLVCSVYCSHQVVLQTQMERGSSKHAGGGGRQV